MNCIYRRVMKSGRVCEFKYSSVDADLVASKTWRCDSRGYIRNDRWVNGNTVCTYLHREILGASEGVHVDHINGDRSDNRRDNLRIASHEENGRNRKVDTRNKSNTTGVCWEESTNRWAAYISVGKKQIRIGSFLKIEDAIAARISAEDEHYGDFSTRRSR